MKTKLVLIGVISLAFAACDQKENPVQAARPETLKTKSSSTEHRTSTFKPVAPKSAVEPKPAIQSEIAQAATAEPAEKTTSPPAAIPPRELSEVEKHTEQLRTERLARMAKAREERVAQAATQISERFKQQDANGDGFLAKDEVSERMQRRFAEADKNSDGFLDATEQQTMVQATAQRMGEGGRQRRGGPADGQGRRNRNQ
jgi:hypothetical protein